MANTSEIIKIYDKQPKYYSMVRREMLAYLPAEAKKVLDIGCSDGLFGKQVKESQSCEVWGVDLSESAVKNASLHLDKAICGNIVENMDILPDHYFDAIYFNDVLEHLVDPYSLLKVIPRKLSSGGVLIASIPNIRHFRTLSKLVFGKDWKYEESGILDKTHLRFFTQKSILRMFQEAGLDVVKCEGIHETKSLKPYIYNVLSLGMIGTDTRFLQFAVVAQTKK